MSSYHEKPSPGNVHASPGVIGEALVESGTEPEPSFADACVHILDLMQ